MEILQMLAGMDWVGIVSNFWIVLGAFATFLVALIALFAKIPGSQPESFLQKVLDFITKYSKK